MKTIWRLGLIGILTAVVGACNSTSTGHKTQVSAPKAVEPAPVTMTFKLSTAGLPASGNWKCDPAFADVNGDGLLDLAAHRRLGAGPKLWLGDGAGQWRETSEGLTLGDTPCGGTLCFGDINRDGNVDLALADHCQGLFVYLGDGAGQWRMTTSALFPAKELADGRVVEFVGFEDIALGDVNGDGFLDLVAGSSDPDGCGIIVYLGDGTGRNWTLHQSALPSTGLANRVVLADVDGDGSLDVVASHWEGPRVWLGDGRGDWRPASERLPTPVFHGLYHGVAVGDVNEDERLDLVVMNWYDGPEVYLQQADGSWQKTGDVFPEMLGGGFGVALGDIDRDGHLDMIVSGRLTREVGFVYGVFALRGDGRGGWTSVADSNLPQTGLPFTWGIALGDVNGDGVLDVVAGSGGTVATNPERAEPAIPAGMLAWLTQLSEH